jgi:hypothetical protein
MPDVVLAEEMASLRHAAKRLAVGSHLVAAEPLVGVVDLPVAAHEPLTPKSRPPRVACPATIGRARAEGPSAA